MYVINCIVKNAMMVLNSCVLYTHCVIRYSVGNTGKTLIHNTRNISIDMPMCCIFMASPHCMVGRRPQSLQGGFFTNLAMCVL